MKSDKILRLAFFYILCISVNILSLQAQVLPFWESTVNSIGSAADAPNWVEIDDVGNVYVAGLTRSGAKNNNIYIAKYDPIGTLLWQEIWEGADHRNDKVNDMTIDDLGNIYLCGSTERYGSTGIHRDALAVKYTTSGSMAWERTFDSGSESEEDANALTLNGSGDVAITGSSGSALNEELLILVYDAAGTLQWSEIPSGGVGAINQGKDIVFDDADNVIVLSSQASFYFSDALMVSKYSLTGTMLWDAEYIGDTLGFGVEPTELTVNGSGEIFAIGTDRSSTGMLLTMVKYSPAGVEEWVSTSDGIGDGAESRNIHHAADGSIYIFGRISLPGTGYAMLTERYAASGSLIWFDVYSFISLSTNPIKMEADDADNIYIAANLNGSPKHCMVLKYDSLGAVGSAFEVHFSVGAEDITCSDFAVSGTGLTALTGGIRFPASGPDIHTVAFDANVDLSWEENLDFIGNADDEPVTVAVNAGEDPYVVYNAFSTGFSHAIRIVKYDQATGSEVWESMYNVGSSNAICATTDAAGNLLIAATTNEIGDFITDILVLKYNSSGVLLWANEYDGPDGYIDEPLAIIVDDLENVYVGGYETSLGEERPILMKYTPAGVEEWVIPYPAPGSYSHHQALTVGTDGMIYVAGTIDNDTTSGLDWDYLTAKYQPDGTLVWAKEQDGLGNRYDLIEDILFDSAGYVYVTGRGTQSLAQGADPYTLQYDLSGNLLWERYYDVGSENGYGLKLGKDEWGNVYVAGAIDVADYLNVLLIKYAVDGTLLLSETWNPGTGDCWVNDFVINEENRPYLTGYANKVSSVSVAERDLFLLEFSLATNTLSQMALDTGTTPKGVNEGISLAIDQGGNLYLAGHLEMGGTGRDVIVRKYDGLVGIAPDLKNESSVRIGPNPAGDNLKVTFFMEQAGWVTFSMLDIHGKEVLSLPDRLGTAGTNTVELSLPELPKGVYLMQVKSEYFDESHKIVLTR